MPVPETKAVSASQAKLRRLPARAPLEGRESGEGGEQADDAGDDHQPEIVLVDDAGIDAQHGLSARLGPVAPNPSW